MSRKSKVYNKIIGISNGSVYVLDEEFCYDDGSFKGCVGYMMSPISQKFIDTHNDIDFLVENRRDWWEGAVRSGRTKEPLQDYMEDLVESCEGLYPDDDPSCREEFEVALENSSEECRKKITDYFDADSDSFGAWNCVSIGRIFNKHMKWEVLFEPELWERIKELESWDRKDLYR